VTAAEQALWSASIAYELRRLAIRTTRWDRIVRVAITAPDVPRAAVPPREPRLVTEQAA
jgi:hypothetical protein